MEKNKGKHSTTWFFKWFLNNQVVTALLIVLLCLLIIFVFTKVSYLFTPVIEFVGIVGLPVIISGLLFYLLNPLVDWLEKKGITRVWGITILYILVVALISWGVVILIPQIQLQTRSLIQEWPNYWRVIEEKFTELLTNPLFEQFRTPLEKTANEIFDSIGQMVSTYSKNAFQGIGNIVGAVASIVVTVVTVPFLLFFLLKDGSKMLPYFTQFLPTKARKPITDVLLDINKQVASYITGQLTVAFAVAVMFIIGFSAIGLDYSVTLGVLAGFLNLIPYVGSALATVPAIVIGIVAGPKMLISVILVFIIEQTLEGRFVSPLVLGSKMEIHPVTIIFVLLTAGKLFGLIGVILGIPGYAAIKVVVTHFFAWYKQVSGLYDDDILEEQQKQES
ncbi:AI-2E family transporter [Vagococcus acidifermentans]|uniref:AI-2E family transporter n=1 Tax=Vagococcus acidifermentans TaxID=564710 RepID=A0A430AVM1_9ENTE|nr:AI-2E family transporter [Vagococcus acidifermentans]RSU12099.1 AI-2E family transporter [Vagococcus acidifermentans]